MSFKHVMDAYELLDSAKIDGSGVRAWLKLHGDDEVVVHQVSGQRGSTDFVRVIITGRRGKRSGGPAPTLGIIGRLGGIGARPERVGIVSDADGAIVALGVAAKAMSMKQQGDQLDGDLIVCTHVCPTAPTIPHTPVPFMSSPVDMRTMNENEVHPEMDAILTVDTTKGNRILNHRGVAVTSTIKEGYILPVAPDLLDLLQYATGQLPRVLPLCTYDITPYGNDLPHINSILQPATATSVPVVGVALTAEVAVPGCATGASYLPDIDAAARFCLEVAKGFGAGSISFYDDEQFRRAVELYGSMVRMQRLDVRR